jgi:hypothetical protein
MNHRGDIDIFGASWKNFFSWVKGERLGEENRDCLEERIDVLREAQMLFRSSMNFAEMDSKDQKALAGFRTEERPRWFWFGHIVAAGRFKKAICSNDENVSRALDHIPLDGPIVEKNYRNFVRTLLLSFVDGGVGLGSATRLLCMKRPDYFVCLNGANIEHLCRSFKIPRNTNLDTYWNRIVKPVMGSTWWSSAEPTESREKEVWGGRAAFLDALFYSESQSPFRCPKGQPGLARE